AVGGSRISCTEAHLFERRSGKSGLRKLQPNLCGLGRFSSRSLRQRRTSFCLKLLWLFRRDVIFQAYPSRSMIAGAWRTADPSVDARFDQLLLKGSIEQQMIDPQPGVLLPMLAKIIPERIDPLVREMRPQGISPALCEQASVTVAGFWLEQRV